MPAKLTQEEFIDRIKNNRSTQNYDYSLSVYTGSNNKVKVICPEHGIFEKRACDLMHGEGCPKCAINSRITNPTFSTEKFIEEARNIHGDKYDYSKSKCQYKKDIVTIVCPEHGEFQQVVSNHLRGNECPKCGYNKLSYNTKTFIEKARKVHGDKYDYSKVNYSRLSDIITIICPEHGEFQQKAGVHLQNRGCPKCGLTIRKRGSKITTEEWVNKAREIHGDRYDYSKVKYINSETKVCIICPKHGEFWKAPIKHTSGQGCPKCSQEVQTKNQSRTKEDLIDELVNIYGDIYDFSKVEYVKMKTPVCVICKKHGEFYARPDHLKNGHGCPMCKESTLERTIRMLLRTANINAISQYHNAALLKKQSFDFYLPDYNIAIECQGEQHFKQGLYEMYKNSNDMTPEESLQYVQELDARKKEICAKNNIRLIYYLENRFAEYMQEDDIYFTNTEDLIEYIKNYQNNNCKLEK